MICRIEGVLESVTGISAVIQPGVASGTSGGGLAYEVLLPAYLARKLAERVSQRITLLTHQYLEAQGQGTSFIPRLIGFETALDRRFFELFTTVKGIGNRRALRALEIEPAALARAITEKDTKALVKLPEIGKRMAETVIAELHGKVESYLSASEITELKSSALAGAGIGSLGRNEPQSQAIEALVALGESRGDAERLVVTAMSRHQGEALRTADDILGAVYGGR